LDINFSITICEIFIHTNITFLKHVRFLSSSKVVLLSFYDTAV